MIDDSNVTEKCLQETVQCLNSHEMVSNGPPFSLTAIFAGTLRAVLEVIPDRIAAYFLVLNRTVVGLE